MAPSTSFSATLALIRTSSLSAEIVIAWTTGANSAGIWPEALARVSCWLAIIDAEPACAAVSSFACMSIASWPLA